MINELYFLIPLNFQTRKEFFEQEFTDGSYDDESCIAYFNKKSYNVDRIIINGEEFLIKDCEVIKCCEINE